MTRREIDLLHKVWLKLSGEIHGQETHDHDVIHFTLDELGQQICNGEHGNCASDSSITCNGFRIVGRRFRFESREARSFGQRFGIPVSQH